MSKQARVGDIRPSQLMFTYGVGAIVDLPKLSVMVMGLDEWPAQPQFSQPIIEERLLMAVRYRKPSVEKLLTPPIVDEEISDPFSAIARVGVPVATFPRWLVCPQCRMLAPISSGLFKLKEHPIFPDRTSYRHIGCGEDENSDKSKTKVKDPEAIPARFLAVCEAGHLDDFPWVHFVHKGQPCREGDKPRLFLREYGPSGEARYLEVSCETCAAKRRLSEAFGKENRKNMPFCTGRRPHLRDTDPTGCGRLSRTILLGASNLWFPVVLSAVAIPVESGRLLKLVDENWAMLQFVQNPMMIEFMRNTRSLPADLYESADAEIWQAIEQRRNRSATSTPLSLQEPDLKEPEWRTFVQCDPALNSDDFRLRRVDLPADWRFRRQIPQVVRVERLREVRAMIGFTRLDAAGELTDPDLNILIDPAPISRQALDWVPADEVRGEGIFFQFDEEEVRRWERSRAIQERQEQFIESHARWRKVRGINPPEGQFPGMRYIMLHSFAHALIRQMALECGYTAASLRERIYARPIDREGGPMAGVLIYTAASDSEGTLGGLISLGRADTLERIITQALESATLCAGDPLCAENVPNRDGRTIHGAACHACLFASETSCERGNKYLDRSTLATTIESTDLAFFPNFIS